MIFTPLVEIANYGDVVKLAKKCNDTLWFGHRDRSQLIIENEHIFINEYKIDTCTIIRKLLKLTVTGIQNYVQMAETWLNG